jgi:glycosyltransferase involved in cell wall biosynthesis
MRAALVNLALGNGLSGVDKAIAGQAKAARTDALPFDVFVVGGQRSGESEGVHYVPLPPEMRRFRRLAPMFKARILSSARELSGYDVLFVRYPTAVDLDPLALLRGARARVVTVHHTKEVDAILSAGRGASLRLRAALERVQGPRILRRVDGIVGVTDEIREYELSRAGRLVPSRTISNGIDVASVPPTGFAPFDGRELHLIFVASFNPPWHGTDRLLGGLRAYRGGVRVTLHMVGQDTGRPPGTQERVGNALVHHHGMLQGDALDRVFRSATLAVSSLSIRRAGLRQACALKTREYVARGIPFILGYDDVDVPDDCPFVLRVHDDDAPIDIEAVVRFAERIGDPSRTSSAMRRYAEEHLAWRVKVRQFLSFAEALLGRR